MDSACGKIPWKPPPHVSWRLGCPKIMGDDEDALLRLWREKRGEVEPLDLSGNLIW